MHYFTATALLLTLTMGPIPAAQPVQNFWQEELALSAPVVTEPAPSDAPLTSDRFTSPITGTIDATALQALSSKSIGWGQGNRPDEYNRPQGAVSAQDTYGQYGAYFIAENSPTVYLTIDEGYENGYTANMLDTLQEKKCPAVFFVTMDYVKKNPALVQRMIDEGHILGNHSLTHPSAGLPSQSLAQQVKEVMAVHDYVQEQFGYEMHLFRYPAGIYSEQSLALLQQLGYHTVFWSFAYQDWVTDDQPDPVESLQKLNKKMHPGAIYLLHAVSSTDTTILGDFIDDTRAAGFTFGKMQ